MAGDCAAGVTGDEEAVPFASFILFLFSFEFYKRSMTVGFYVKREVLGPTWHKY